MAALASSTLCQLTATAGVCGTTRLDGLRCAGIFRWPGPIHEGKGEGLHIIDRRATPEQREALLRILRGEDTEPGATVYQVFASTCDTFHDPIVADIDFELDIDGRRAGDKIEGSYICVFKQGAVETFRIWGVPRPETFRHTCLKAQMSFVGVQQAKAAGLAV